MSDAAIGGVVFDVAGVRSFCRRDDLYAESVVWACVDTGDVIVIPSVVLAEARADIAAGALEVLAVLLELPNTVVPAFDTTAADRCAELLARLPADQRNVVSAAQAVAEAVDRGWPVVTDRGQLLQALDHRVIVDPLP
ncbi:hypothetical protein IU500_34485 [Nocardia terpenica]|uniref:hypothetical protein n=1 Tax=Nocardia terpenica TaxID=455432 RepID=UPI001892E97A|nr:hypothetical protein [Nocardia terpenica]MBF6065442.1 hypothetical protein [Nocardia terpenica]MBF6109124.1 hypothetical protein [Nocardia terpenica]MBF6114674.1 hypothetical protein [Nocardia terpenica]MBF6123359.1 hypothetical protein [Nocardia terpenica]MBF6156623.1 hypothetical protein [Nocardia terpenica]